MSKWVESTINGSGMIEIFPIDTLEQPPDLLTKPLDLASFQKHRLAIMGWLLHALTCLLLPEGV
jgi:hypothetical protein